MRNYGSHPEDVRNKSEDMMKGYGKRSGTEKLSTYWVAL